MTVITILLALMLAIFSTLTLASARADLSLSQTNADTVTAYYRADARAVELYEAFVLQTGDALDTTIAIHTSQALRIHLVRRDGTVQILAWQTVPTGQGAGDSKLPVWGG